MNKNISLVPFLFAKEFGLSRRVFFNLLKTGKTRSFLNRNYGHDHFKNITLVYFKLTSACNLRCVMCGQYGDKGNMKDCAAEESKKNLPLETWKRFIDEIAPQNPVTYLWGGEPFLYPDLIPLVRYIMQKGLVMSLNTNGTMMEKYAEDIVRDKWSAIMVSLDAFRDVNDELRGKGSYDRVIAGLKAINREKKKQKSKFPFLSLVTVVTNKNYMYLEDLTEASREYDIDFHVFNLGTYTNDNIVAEQRRFMREKLDTEIDCLGSYNTGYNLGIDGQKLHNIIYNIQRKNYGHPILTVPALNPEKTHTYYADLETPVRNH